VRKTSSKEAAIKKQIRGKQAQHGKYFGGG
jgi:hypothetical protein